jgi:NDP-sugar pyrophosphorylase family protein
MTKPVVVLAGGMGTRVSHFAKGLPKGMLPVAGHPFIDWKLKGLADQGADQVMLLVSHGADAIEGHVGTGQRYGLRLTCIRDGPQLLGTGGAIAAVLDRLPDRFWVTYGDTLLRVPLADVEDFLDDRGGLAVMTVLANRDRWETSNVSVAADEVVAYDKTAETGTHPYIDYGMLLFDARAFADRRPGETFDLGEIIEALIEITALKAFQVKDRFYDVGTEQRYAETCRLAERNALWSVPDE